MARTEPAHRQILELIPWYVNGTLDEREMDRLSAHLADCNVCSSFVDQEVTLARRLRSDPAGLADVLAAQDQAFETLHASLRTDLRSSSRPRWLALAATVTLVAAASFFVGRVSMEPSYELLTDQSPYSGHVIQIIFHRETSERAVRELLSDGGGQLLGNPSAKGVYRIGLPREIDAPKYVARVQIHPSVRWAELELL